MRTSVSAIARVLVARDPRACPRVGACVGAKPIESGADEGCDEEGHVVRHPVRLEDVFTRAVRAAWARRAPGARRIAAFIA